ncbi:MAG: glycoside hydrolase family 16 protein [Aeoliella sp.]
MIHRVILAIALLSVSSLYSTVDAQELLLRDDFDGTGIVDPSVWRIPFGGEGSFVGRTQFRGDFGVDFPAQGVTGGTSDGKVLEIDLDTFSPIDPGNQFLGTDILTKRNFARAGGITIEARMRLKPTTAGGLVNGFFLFDVTRDTPEGTNTLVRDEIDWELLSNQATGGSPPQDPASNFWNDGPFTGPNSGGDFQFHDVSGVDLTQFQDYKIEWTPDNIKWFVNDNLVRTQTTNIPDDPMKLHFNIWAAADDFGAAYDATLQPAATAAANQKFQVQVDHVEVNRINTTTTEKLANGGFEAGVLWSVSGNGPAPTFDADTETGEWIGFNRTSLEFGTEVAPSEGLTTVKMFGPFKGSTDASGVFQNAAATPGQEFEASVKAFAPSFDPIRPNPDGDFNNDGVVDGEDYTVWRDNLGATLELPNDTTGEAMIGQAQHDLWAANYSETGGTENFTTIALSFHDANGDVLQERFGLPEPMDPDSNLRDKNGQETPIFDGRDPNLDSLEDEWIKYQVNAIAPAGTAFVRYNLFFIQIANEGGSVQFDEASLLLLEPTTSGSLQLITNVPEPSGLLLLLPALFATAGWQLSRRTRVIS